MDVAASWFLVYCLHVVVSLAFLVPLDRFVNRSTPFLRMPLSTLCRISLLGAFGGLVFSMAWQSQ